jgi:hypothetical protein
MPITSTTVRVSTRTRDYVRQLAEDDGVTLDVEIERLARAERQRRMGAALADAAIDEPWLDAVAQEVVDASR